MKKDYRCNSPRCNIHLRFFIDDNALRRYRDFYLFVGSKRAAFRNRIKLPVRNRDTRIKGEADIELTSGRSYSLEIRSRDFVCVTS